MSRAAAGSRSRPSRIATPNAATPRAGILIPEAQGSFKPETADQNLSLGGSRGPFSFAKENGLFFLLPRGARHFLRAKFFARAYDCATKRVRRGSGEKRKQNGGTRWRKRTCGARM